MPTAITCPTSILEVDDFGIDNTLKVYPNPIKDIINVSLDKEITTISIYNLLGQELISKSINSNKGKIEVSSLSSGTYIVKVNSDNSAKSIKVIKD